MYRCVLQVNILGILLVFIIYCLHAADCCKLPPHTRLWQHPMYMDFNFTYNILVAVSSPLYTGLPYA